MNIKCKECGRTMSQVSPDLNSYRCAFCDTEALINDAKYRSYAELETNDINTLSYISDKILGKKQSNNSGTYLNLIAEKLVTEQRISDNTIGTDEGLDKLIEIHKKIKELEVDVDIDNFQDVYQNPEQCLDCKYAFKITTRKGYRVISKQVDSQWRTLSGTKEESCPECKSLNVLKMI